MARQTIANAIKMSRERNMTFRLYGRHRSKEYCLYKGIHEQRFLGHKYLTRSTYLKDIFDYLDKVKPTKNTIQNTHENQNHHLQTNI